MGDTRFQAYQSTEGAYADPAGGIVVWDTVLHENGLDYNTSDGKVTVGTTGYYHMFAYVATKGTGQCIIKMILDSADEQVGYFHGSDATMWLRAFVGTTKQYSSGDTLWVTMDTAASNIYHGGYTMSGFYGWRLA